MKSSSAVPARTPKEDPNTSLFSIDVIEVPLATPSQARIVNQPRIFMNETGNIAGLWQGGDHGPNTQRSRLTNQCHDITVYSEIGLAAGACSGNGILMDISDPRNPKRLDSVIDKGFAYWHSATFNNDGTKVLFTDEWGGGGAPRCRAVDPLTWGADAIYDIVDGKLVHKGYYKMPAAQTEQENCVAHNGSLIPVPGRDIMVQAWYQGGLSVFDFTDSANAKEIAYFDRGPINGEAMLSGGYWSTYWYNGNLYGSEMARGIDVFRLKPSEFLSQNEIDAAMQFRLQEFNSQNQPKVAWQPTTGGGEVVCRSAEPHEGHLGRARARDQRGPVEGGLTAHRQGEQREGRARRARRGGRRRSTPTQVEDRHRRQASRRAGGDAPRPRGPPALKVGAGLESRPLVR